MLKAVDENPSVNLLCQMDTCFGDGINYANGLAKEWADWLVKLPNEFHKSMFKLPNDHPAN